MNSKPLKHALALVILPFGVLLTLVIPELGVPLILLSTRMLRDKFDWARKLDAFVVRKWSKSKRWFARTFKKKR